MEAATAAPKPADADSLAECPDCLSGNLGWLLSQAHFNLVSEIAAAFGPLGVSNRGYNVLATARAGEFTQKELAEQIGLDKTTMVVTVDELEAQGLAERRPSKTDRRARVIVVTKKGARRVLEANDVVARVHEEVLEVLPERERRIFLEALGKLVGDSLGEPVHCAQPVRRRAPRAALASK